MTPLVQALRAAIRERAALVKLWQRYARDSPVPSIAAEWRQFERRDAEVVAMWRAALAALTGGRG